MTAKRYEIALRRGEREKLTLGMVASCADLRPALVERFVEFGLF